MDQCVGCFSANLLSNVSCLRRNCERGFRSSCLRRSGDGGGLPRGMLTVIVDSPVLIGCSVTDGSMLECFWLEYVNAQTSSSPLAGNAMLARLW